MNDIRPHTGVEYIRTYSYYLLTYVASACTYAARPIVFLCSCLKLLESMSSNTSTLEFLAAQRILPIV